MLWPNCAFSIFKFILYTFNTEPRVERRCARKRRRSVSSWAWTPISFATLLTVQDSARMPPEGYSEAKKLALWTKKGKQFLTADGFERFINECSFDSIECLYDDQNSPSESKKRIKKMHERTESFVDTFFSPESSSRVGTQIKTCQTIVYTFR